MGMAQKTSRKPESIHISSYQWFVDTLGHQRGNRMAFEAVGEENASESMKCSDGVERPLWKFPAYESFSRFKRAADTMKIQYKVFVREGQHGSIRPWRFAKKVKRKILTPSGVH